MKKASEWFEDLPDGYRERALANLDYDDEHESLGDALGGGFNWCRTQEGYNFWGRVYYYCCGDEHTLPPPLPEDEPVCDDADESFCDDADNRESPFSDNADARKTFPMYRGLIKYFPNALARVAHISWRGNHQHHPDKELHWDKAKSSDEPDALIRHIVDYSQSGDLDELAKVAWRALAWYEREQCKGDENK